MDRLQVISLLQEGKKESAIRVFPDLNTFIDQMKRADLSAVRTRLEKELTAA